MSCPRVVLAASVALAAGACKNNTLEIGDAGDLEDTGGGGSSETTLGDDDGSVATTATTGAVPPPPMTTVTTVTTATSDSGWSELEDGWWLLALDTGSPGLPYQFVVSTLETAPGVWDVTLQPLALDVGSTTSPRFPVGEPTFYPGVEFGADVPLKFYTGVLTIPGEANPINGTAVTLDAYLDGSDLGDPFCGPVTGDVLEPIQADLAGSTFATTRIPDPAALPLDFPSACP